jgi:hypothetical protein
MNARIGVVWWLHGAMASEHDKPADSHLMANHALMVRANAKVTAGGAPPHESLVA